eukprot:gene15527-18445_t
MPVTLRELFNYGRWKKPVTLRHLLFALYLPFGLAIWPFRLLFNILLFSTILLLPKDKIYLIRPFLKIEGGLTSGKTGMMTFQKFVFGLGHPVLPISMKITSPWPIDIDYINSSWFKNFAWWLMVPFHTFELNVLPSERIRENETDVQFAKRIQTIIANDLGIEPTDFAYANKKELSKELLKRS